jgi:hypothetical protein
MSRDETDQAVSDEPLFSLLGGTGEIRLLSA